MNIRPVLAALLAAATLAGCATGQWPQPPAAMPATGPGPTTAPVTGQIPHYDRDAFGDWGDADRDSCDTREELLEAAAPSARDTDGDGCRDDGPVIDGYTHELIPNPRLADIDHALPLAVMWEGGAHTWTDGQREAAANYAPNLIVTHRSINRSKGSQGPDEWRPADPGTWCTYRNAWVSAEEFLRLQWPPEQTAAYDAALEDMCPGGSS